MGGPRAPAGCFPVHNALPLGWRRTLRKTAFSCDTFFPTVLSSIFSNLPSPIFLLPGEASSRLTDGISCHGEVTASSTRRRVEERDKAASGIDLVPKFPTQPLSIDLKKHDGCGGNRKLCSRPCPRTLLRLKMLDSRSQERAGFVTKSPAGGRRKGTGEIFVALRFVWTGVVREAKSF
ncbi:uncharacterized protein LOC127766088 isoform X1 [Oryza glaberrima]|uniref:uncharacterized protein LOC127766088 isoform X1 n=1 Tax=Oryza glaberrima TaxID=4538 RepID=UPI00224C4407|nr:uncharacterized protein LOC127766088 isoform X1 [Oryza glaberrima]